MIDDIQINYHLVNSDTHILEFPFWEIEINESTGERVNENKKAIFKGLNLLLKPSKNGGYLLIVNGSLHKYYNWGKYDSDKGHNTDQFNFESLVESIQSLMNMFCIDAKDCTIHGMEIGLNLPLPYDPNKIIKNLVCYRNSPFTLINKRNAGKGKVCALSQYSVKVYDKAKVSGIKCGYILRLEKHFDKMQALQKWSISTLADLLNKDKVFALIAVINEILLNIIWTDTTVNLDRLLPREKNQWLYYENPRTWKEFGKDKRVRAKKAWNKLLNKYGKPPDIYSLVNNVWEMLFIATLKADNPQKPQPSYRPILNNESRKIATILPLECTVKRLHTTNGKVNSENTRLNIRVNNNVKEGQIREIKFGKCLSCQKDISQQRKGSIFCSEKLYGKDAKKCRNQNSNQRQSKKRKIARAAKQNKQLSITYQDGEGNFHTCTLPANKIKIDRQQIDRITNILAI